MLQISDAWKQVYPGSLVGTMVMEGVDNPPENADLSNRKKEFEESVRKEFGGYTRQMLEALPAIQPYVAYYRKFNKNYHVLFQIESVALKGKSLPNAAALVEAMFMSELKNQLLTAGHDLDLLVQPLKLDVARGDESYITLGGKEQILKPEDMFISDGKGIISSILSGPDQRTPIGPATRRVLFVVYAPEGVGTERVTRHLEDIRANVELVSPQAKTIELKIHGA